MSLPRERNTPAQVLIVEDNPTIRLLMRVTLEKAGYVITEAGDSQAAMDVVESNAPDVVLVDYGLPDMNGAELCRRIRDTPQGHRIPVILISGGATEDDDPSPFTAALTKPVDTKRLLEQLEVALAGSAPRSP